MLGELSKTVECGICLEVMYLPLVGQCGHSFCRACVLRLLRECRVCPVCRGDFGRLEERPPNILVKSLVQHYFPVDYERRRLRSQRDDEEQTALSADAQAAVAPLVLRPRALPVASVGVGGGRGDEARALWQRLLTVLRPAWPVVKWALPLLYPLLLLLLWLSLRDARSRRRIRSRFLLLD